MVVYFIIQDRKKLGKSLISTTSFEKKYMERFFVIYPDTLTRVPVKSANKLNWALPHVSRILKSQFDQRCDFVSQFSIRNDNCKLHDSLYQN